MLKKSFIALLSKIVNGYNHANCVLLSNQKCMIQPTPVNLRPNVIFTCFFVNYLCTIDSCFYLLLSNKILIIYCKFTSQIMNSKKLRINNINQKWVIKSKI